ncbi:MAG: hypothetical protein WCP19_01820 [Chloroflexota bacterium]
MAKLIPAADRLILARELILKAREYPVPEEGGRYDFSYVAHVKDLVRQAKDMVKYLPQSAGASKTIKDDAVRILREAEQAEEEILHG